MLFIWIDLFVHVWGLLAISLKLFLARSIFTVEAGHDLAESSMFFAWGRLSQTPICKM